MFQQQIPNRQTTPVQMKDSSGCLQAWVIAALILNAIGLLFSLGGAHLSSDPLNFYPALSDVLYAVTIVGYVGVLFSKKWGYFLVLSLYALLTLIRMVLLGMVPALASQGILPVFAGVIGGFIFYALCRNAAQSFD